MLSDSISSPFLVTAAIFGVLGVIAVFAGIAELTRARPLKFALRTLTGLLLLALGALAGALASGVQGYRALTYEEIAARITVQPAGAKRYTATFRFPDGREATFALAGDEIYVDAHILKWKAFATLLGLRNVYELDRVAGRYHAIEQERTAVRTVHRLGQDRAVDLFGWRRRYAFLSPLVDAEYGSGTFVPVTRQVELELRVSTTGLLIREK